MIGLTITSKQESEILERTKQIKEFENRIQSASDEELKNISAQLEKNKYDLKGFLEKPLSERNAISLNYTLDNKVTQEMPMPYNKKSSDKIRKNLMSKVKEKCLGQIKLSVGEGVKSATIVDIKSGGVEGGAIIELTGNDGRKKKYMLKGLHIQNGKYLSKPNAKSPFRAFLTRQTLADINRSTLEEYIALKMANIFAENVAPDVKLGRIDRGNGNVQYCILTEIAGQDEGEKFHTFEEISKEGNAKLSNIGKDIFKTLFAVSVGLLNDQDVNKLDNIGYITQQNNDGLKNGRLCLFDLGHPTPDKFKLNPETLLPESTSVLADIILWIINLFVSANNLPWTFTMDINIRDKLTPKERYEALKNLVEDDFSKKINTELSNLKTGFSDGDKVLIEEFHTKVKSRIKYLETVLREHEKIENEKVKQHTKNA